jgi:general secretion pathway protein C
VVPGVTVLEVHARHVLLRDGGVSKRIDLVADDKALALPGPVSASPAPATNLVPPPLPMEQQRPATMMPAPPQVSSTGTPPSN